ncbi:MAG: hypothetical protein AAF828_04660, partial [Bacteroidota bacterium]
YPGETFADQPLYTLSSYLLRLLRRFIAQQQWEREEVNQRISLLAHGLSADQPKLFVWASKRIEKELAAASCRNSELFHRQYTLWQYMNAFYLKYGRRNSDEHLIKAHANLDIYLLGEKMKLSCQTLARHQVTGQEYDLPLSSLLIQYVHEQQAYFSTQPSVWLYYLSYQLMATGAEVYYFELRQQLRQHKARFPADEARDLYTVAINYCVKAINFGQENYRRETFEVYQEMLAEGLLYRNGQLPQWDFTNIVALGCRLGDYTWTENFMQNEKKRLAQEQAENTYSYNLAAYYYSRAEYDQALYTLQSVAFTDTYYNLLSRILQLEIYYDTAQWQTLDYQLDAFRLFLLRQRNLEPQRRKSSQRFLQFTRRLLKLREAEKLLDAAEIDQRKAQLHDDIRQSARVLNKAWLLARVK